VTTPRLRKLARRIGDSEEVLLHTGPGLLAGTDLPVDELTEAVWDDQAQFTHERFDSDPEQLWADWLAFWDEASVDPDAFSPQPVHDRVGELVAEGYVTTVLTENVFGLLRAAGVPADSCIEYHGRIDEARCEFCGRTYDVSPAQAAGHRQCRVCDGTLGPGIVLAGEPPAKSDRLLAWARAESCDLYVAAGSRLTVHPTVENAEYALETGAELAVLSDRQTALDSEADYRISGDPGSTLSKLRDALAIMG
jgi:NAD-dependent deacetylase